MPRDGENLFRRKGDRFWSFKYKGLDGKWHEESTGKELKSDARDERNDRLARYRAGQTTNDMSGWTLKRAVQEHLALRMVQATASAVPWSAKSSASTEDPLATRPPRKPPRNCNKIGRRKRRPDLVTKQ